MLKRIIQTILTDLLTQYPVITITGPRQSGKTTLVRTALPNCAYYNLENPDTLAFIQADPKQFLQQINLQQGVILDEIQRFPEFLSYLQPFVDEQRVPGSFILTGSYQLALTEAITQSLAGRTALLELLPLTINELLASQPIDNVNQLLLSGLFPGIYQHHLEPTIAARNYIKTYVERDVRQLINIKNLHSFQRCLGLCAGRVGSLINRESLSNDVGVTTNTIQSWLSILEASYIVRQVQPYFENFGKRLIKSPKLYFYDVGLVAYLLGIDSIEKMNIDKLRGSLFENLVLLEIVKYFYNRGREAPVYFFRDSHNNEVDFVIAIRDQLIPIEVKVTSTFHTGLLKSLKYFHELVGERAPSSYLVYTGEEERMIGATQLINYKNISKFLESIINS